MELLSWHLDGAVALGWEMMFGCKPASLQPAVQVLQFYFGLPRCMHNGMGRDGEFYAYLP